MRTGRASVEQLIAHGGWALDDAQARHAAHPDSFWLPPAEDLARLAPGTTARLIFQVADQADPVVDGLDPYGADGRPNLVVSHERMWLWVESVTGRGGSDGNGGADPALVGVLMNQPIGTHTRLVPGARVRFGVRDVIDLGLEPRVPMDEDLARLAADGFPPLELDSVTAPEDPGRIPTIAPRQAAVCARYGVRPERPCPVPTVCCLVGRSLGPDTWPVFGVRTPPKPERSDCGWALWSGEADFEDAAEADGFEVLPVTDLWSRNRRAWGHLALPPGWAFVLGSDDDHDDVYQDPALLEE